jgi:HK97 family phage major capsid protein
MNIQQLEREHENRRRYAKDLLDRTTAQCEDEGRSMTASERLAIDRALQEAKSIKARIDRARGDDAMNSAIAELTAGMGPTPDYGGGHLASSASSIGEQFTNNDAYRRFISAGGHRRAGTWTSPFIESSGPLFTMRAATLTTDTASGGALVLPDNRPGIVMLPQRPVVLADLPAPGTTDSNVVQFMKETTFTNAAATVAQGASKPESTLIFATATSPVQKIAHWIPVTEEMLEDYAQTRSVVDGRLRIGLQVTEDDQLLNGDGVSPNLLGFMNLTGLAADQARGADTNADAVAKQIAAIATSVYMVPDGVVMHPSNWLTVQLAKDTTGNYISGVSPLDAPTARTLWGLPVALTPAITAGTALVGCFKSSSQIFRKGGVRVEASNSHSDFFVKNLVAVRGEERLALAVYREAAFGKVTGLA